MSLKRVAQGPQRAEVLPTPEAREHEQRPQVGAWPVDVPFPALLTDADLRRVLDVSWATFYRLKKLQRFRAFIADPVLTTTVRYSGVKVRQWVDGGGLPQARRSFGSHAGSVVR